MTNEQINKAIAEELGKTVDWHDGIPYWLGMWSSVGEGNESFAEFKPASDLNAMHEAEKMLTDHQHRQYRKEVWYSVCEDLSSYEKVKAAERPHYSATARQRAEAFLKTIGKWGRW